MDISCVESYFASGLHKPFYLLVGDEEYQEARKNLKSRMTQVLRVSDCCRSQDRLPDLGKLKDDMTTADVSCDYNRVLVLGLGEYLALQGEAKTREYLASLSDLNLGTGKAVILLRGMTEQLRILLTEDVRRRESGCIEIASHASTNISLELAEPELGIYELRGLKFLLRHLEEGATGLVRACTSMTFPHSLLNIKLVRHSYEAIARHLSMGGIIRDCGTEDLWNKLLAELRHNDFRMDKVWEAHGIIPFQNADLHRCLEKEEYEAWLCYIYLVSLQEEYRGHYLGYVMQAGAGLTAFKHNLVYAIDEISPTEQNYWQLYEERKRLLAEHSGAEMSAFVTDISRQQANSIYRLTDNTMIEKQAIIIWIGKNGLPDFLQLIYPDLAMYLSGYAFSGNGIGESFAAFLTKYIEHYKKQKVTQNLSADFLQQVEELAKERVYNTLPHRDGLVKHLRKVDTFLLWIDALGLEYVSYIANLADKYGLSLSVQIGQVNLPTITERNKTFFDEWPGDKKKIQDLDETKHKEAGGYYFGDDSDFHKYPVYLAKELEIVQEAMEAVAADLGSRRHERVVIASDHGASRLAVLRKKEERYDTDTQGKHSGRCCKFFPGCDLAFAIKDEDNGFITLADYGRFKGSRAANVEVHGGASLEEVVVPVLTLSLRDSSFVVEVVEQELKVDYKKGVSFTLYINKIIHQDLKVSYEGRRYATKRQDDNHYVVVIPEIVKAGAYTLDAYLGDNLVGRLGIKVVGRGALINSDFDDLI